MGIDYENCSVCSDIFPDCNDHTSCQRCDALFCSDCMRNADIFVYGEAHYCRLCRPDVPTKISSRALLDHVLEKKLGGKVTRADIEAEFRISHNDQARGFAWHCTDLHAGDDAFGGKEACQDSQCATVSELFSRWDAELAEDEEEEFARGLCCKAKWKLPEERASWCGPCLDSLPVKRARNE